MFDAERSIAEAFKEFKLVVDYVRDQGQSHDAYTVERRLFRNLLAVGLRLLGAYFEKKQGGDAGPAIETEPGQRLPRERRKSRSYLRTNTSEPLSKARRTPSRRSATRSSAATRGARRSGSA